ncbi:MAG: PqqD family peptide modification chaperone [Arenicella sp.]
MPIQLGNSTYITQDPSINAREFDGETVMMNKTLDSYFGLDEVATRIWQIIEKQHTIIEIRDILVTEYDISPEQCLDDIRPFIEKLITDELAIIVES